MTETAAELRARLGVLAEAVNATWEGESSAEITANIVAVVAFQNALVNSWPAIDGMLARLATAEADAAHWKANHEDVVRRKQATAAFLSIARAHARGLRADLAAAEKARCASYCPLYCEPCGGPCRDES